MRKLLYPALVCIALTIATLSCGGGSGAGPTPTPSSTATSTSTFLTYTNESHGFSIIHPSDWEVDEEACTECGGPLVALKAPQSCGNLTTQFEIKKDELAETMNIEEYFDYKEQDILFWLNDYTPISNEELTVDGRDAIQHEFTYNTFGQTMYIIALFLLDDDIGWYMYCTCTVDCASECEDVFDTMAGSFRLID